MGLPVGRAEAVRERLQGAVFVEATLLMQTALRLRLSDGVRRLTVPVGGARDVYLWSRGCASRLCEGRTAVLFVVPGLAPAGHLFVPQISWWRIPAAAAWRRTQTSALCKEQAVRMGDHHVKIPWTLLSFQLQKIN